MPTLVIHLPHAFKGFLVCKQKLELDVRAKTVLFFSSLVCKSCLAKKKAGRMSGNQRTTARHKEALCHNHREKGGHRREKLPRHRRLSSRDMGGTRDCWDHTASVVHHRTPRGSKIREAFSFCVTVGWHFCDRISGLQSCGKGRQDLC